MPTIFCRFAVLAGLLLLGDPALAGSCGGRDLLAGASGQALAARVAPFAETLNAESVFWRITAPDPAVPPSYLFGTVHLTDDRVTALPATVSAALAGADVLAVEVLDTAEPQPEYRFVRHIAAQAVYPDGRSLQSVLPEDDYEALMAAFAARQVPGWYFAGWKPWAVLVSALAFSPCEIDLQGQGRHIQDIVLVRQARDADIPVVALEEVAHQFDTIAAVPEEVQVAMLQATLALESKVDDRHETVVQLYLAGRIGMVLGLSKALLAEVAPGVDFAPYWRGQLDSRHGAMVESATKLARGGNAFIATGAEHLIGDSGLVAGLRRAGFAVEAVR